MDLIKNPKLEIKGKKINKTTKTPRENGNRWLLNGIVKYVTIERMRSV